jgi:hypothetical protein
MLRRGAALALCADRGIYLISDGTAGVRIELLALWRLRESVRDRQSRARVFTTKVAGPLYREIRTWVIVAGRLHAVANDASPCQ